MICSTRLRLALARSTPACTSAWIAGAAASSAAVAAPQSMRGGEARRGDRVEHDQRGVVRAPIADRDRAADQRARRLELVLDVRRRHVLAGRVDDQLLLAVDDAHVAVGVDLGDVAGVQPAVGVDRLGRALGVVAIAAHHDRAAHEQLAVVRERKLDPGDRHADGADADRVLGVDGRDQRGLGHAPHLADRQPERGEELEHLGGDRRRP